MKSLGLPNINFNDDGREFKFIGIWSKNRWEWLATHIANMYYKYTTIGFFDSMGVQAVDFIIKQTELTSLFLSKEYIQKIISMKKDGFATTITQIVSFESVT